MMAKKRRRSESFNDDAHKRLEDFGARMFETPQQDIVAPSLTTLNVLSNAKRKKHSKKFVDMAEEKLVPIVKFSKKKKSSDARVHVEKVARTVAVKDVVSTKIQEKKKLKKAKLLQSGFPQLLGEERDMDPYKQELNTVKDQRKREKQENAKKTKCMQLHARKRNNDTTDSSKQEMDGFGQRKGKQEMVNETEDLQWHPTQQEKEGNSEDEADPLEQALNSIKDQIKKKMPEKVKNIKPVQWRPMPFDQNVEEGDGVDLLKQADICSRKQRKQQKKKHEVKEETKVVQLHKTEHMEEGEDGDEAELFEQALNTKKSKKKQEKRSKPTTVKGLSMQHKEEGDDGNVAEQELYCSIIENDKKMKKKMKFFSEQQIANGNFRCKSDHLPQPLNKWKEKKEKKENMNKKQLKATKSSQWHSKQPSEEKENIAFLAEQAKKQTKQEGYEKTKSSQQKEDRKDDGLGSAEQAVHKRKKITSKQEVTPLHKEDKISVLAVSGTEVNTSKSIIKSEKDAQNTAEISNSSASAKKRGSIRPKKKSKKLRNLSIESSKEAVEKLQMICENAEKTSVAALKVVTEAGSFEQKSADEFSSGTATTQVARLPASQQRLKDNATRKSVEMPTFTMSQIVSDSKISQQVSKTNTTKGSTTATPKKINTTPEKDTAVTKINAPTTNCVGEKDHKMKVLDQLQTPIAASLAEDATKKSDMFLPAHQIMHQHITPANHTKKAPPYQLDTSSSAESESDDVGSDFARDEGVSSLFSRLIDSAAREQWELLEVGRLVRLFAAEWNFKKTKTAQFLLRICPELVSVDFLEGLGVNLTAKQLVQVFEAGSGNSSVLINKMASAVENGHLRVQDLPLISALERRVALMETNTEVLELLHPLLESLSTVRDVGALVKHLCQHWHLERKTDLVQQILLSNVFDDLDGNQDDICLDLPDLNGRLDFPSRLDQEDVDENGNLKGLVVDGDGSELSGVEGSAEEEDDDEESEDGVDLYEGETDSDEEIEFAGRSRGHHRFIEDEAEVGEDDEEEAEEEDHSDESVSSLDSF
ncbi:uncharacterized protein PHALS_00541 [Plasmopara halstedii]|uniref:Uncharacterized protein n=1 Tax=Plasmopara halstedii TaxID=4781 RepID=A0A0P1A7I1_PLAHL|nr:uncharacterized protein PHALS_00541 [Plasmopara halstedii]CEG36222.1 hypothetical protein PHALS_00541 [Plasmopara halstedii]|eukprot:XP_024572591.1 hypothetical protein PHALS_00541 [Plasmopara halstedii]